MMKSDAVLVNAARGPVVDEVALVAHLKANPNFRAGQAAAGCLALSKLCCGWYLDRCRVELKSWCCFFCVVVTGEEAVLHRANLSFRAGKCFN